MAGKLKPAKSKAGTAAIPSKQALLDCFSVVTTAEAAKYMESQFKSKFGDDLKKGKPESNVFMRVLETIVNFARNVSLQRESRENPWLGGAGVKTDFQNLQKNIAETNIKSLQSKGIDNINVYFSVKNGELSYAFKPDTAAAEMTKLSLASLAEEGMISKKGTIYNADDHGKGLEDAAGKPMKASDEKIMQNISGNLLKSLERNGIKATAEFITPGAESKAAPQPVAPVVPVGLIKPVEAVKPEPVNAEPEAETPRGGMSGGG